MSRRIAPGLWVDDEDALHISVPELLEEFGWPDNEHNREMVTQVAVEMLAREFPGVPVTERPSCPHCGTEGMQHGPGCPER